MKVKEGQVKVKVKDGQVQQATLMRTDLEFLSDKVEIVPASVAEEAGVEGESNSGRRCRRLLQSIAIFLSSCTV